MATIQRLQIAPGQTATFPAGGEEYIILEYVSGDIDGATIQSDTPGVAALVTFPAGVLVTGCTFIDIDNSNGVEVDASDPSNTDGTGNTNIAFYVAPVSTNNTIYDLSISIGIMI